MTDNHTTLHIAVGTYINTSIYGSPERVLVLAIHPMGTIDVQRADGQCFRVSGLAS